MNTGPSHMLRPHSITWAVCGVRITKPRSTWRVARVAGRADLVTCAACLEAMAAQAEGVRAAAIPDELRVMLDDLCRALDRADATDCPQDLDLCRANAAAMFDLEQAAGKIRAWLRDDERALTARDERIAALEAGLREACDIIDDLDFRGDFDTDRGRIHALAGPGCPRCHGPAANPATITTTDGRRVEICGACEAVRLRALADAGKVAP